MPGSRYLHVLRRPGVARLVAPTLIARVPDAIAGTAIVVLARSATGSYSAAGLAAGAFGLGTAVSAPLAGRAIDRLGQRRVLPLLAAGFAAALAVTALGADRLATGVVTAVSAVAGLVRPPVEAALRALWPRLVLAADLDTAYSLDSTLQELIWIGGPLLLAVLLAAGQPQLPLIACAVASIGGTALYTLGLPAAPRGATVTAPAPSPLRQSRLRVLLTPAACYGVAAGILNLALVAFAGGHGGTSWAGVLVAIWGVGSLAGGRPWRSPVEIRAMACLALFAVFLMLLAASPSLIVTALLMIPLGVPLSPWLGSLSAAVRRSVPEANSTEAFAWTFTVITAGMSAGSASGGLIIQTASTQAAFLAAGGCGLAGAALGALRLRATRLPRPTE